jgi:hypothetical protein
LKTGAIISVAGKAPNNWSKEDEKAFRKKLSIFNSVRIITPQISSPFMMNRICIDFIAKGVTDIVIIEAKFHENKTLIFKSRIVKLSMVGLN